MRKVWGYLKECGLRWYKNRVVMSYYPDSKALVGFNDKGRIDHAPMDIIQRRSIITMLDATSGRIESATSLTKLDAPTLYDLGRAFPMHGTPQSARPVDAFTGLKTPRVYAFRVDDQWQQVALCNDEPSPNTVKDRAKVSRIQSPHEFRACFKWHFAVPNHLCSQHCFCTSLHPGQAPL